MLPNELTDRGRMIEQRQDLFSEVIVFLVPRTEIVVNVTFPPENRKRLEKQACVVVGGCCKTKWSVIPLLPLRGENERADLLTRNRMSLCTDLVFGEMHSLSNYAVDRGVILASAAKPSPARMSGTLIA